MHREILLRLAITEVLCHTKIPVDIQGIKSLVLTIERISDRFVDEKVFEQMEQAKRKGILTNICTAKWASNKSVNQCKLVVARYPDLDAWASELYRQEVG